MTFLFGPEGVISDRARGGRPENSRVARAVARRRIHGDHARGSNVCGHGAADEVAGSVASLLQELSLRAAGGARARARDGPRRTRGGVLERLGGRGGRILAQWHAVGRTRYQARGDVRSRWAPHGHASGSR